MTTTYKPTNEKVMVLHQGFDIVIVNKRVLMLI